MKRLADLAMVGVLAAGGMVLAQTAPPPAAALGEAPKAFSIPIAEKPMCFSCTDTPSLLRSANEYRIKQLFSQNGWTVSSPNSFFNGAVDGLSEFSLLCRNPNNLSESDQLIVRAFREANINLQGPLPNASFQIPLYISDNNCVLHMGSG